MSKKLNNGKKKKLKTSEENLQNGISLIKNHSLFGYLTKHLYIKSNKEMGKEAAAYVSSGGFINVNKDILHTPKQWQRIIAHCQLHLAFGHFDKKNMPSYETTDLNGNVKTVTKFNKFLWNEACDIYVEKFLSDIKIGEAIYDIGKLSLPNNLKSELDIYYYFVENNYGDSVQNFGTGSSEKTDMIGLEEPLEYKGNYRNYNVYAREFIVAMANSVSDAISVAGGHNLNNNKNTIPQKAARWFIDHYPLLGGLASGFKIIEDYNLCAKEEIHVAAIDVGLREIYVNPVQSLDEEQWRFILAHEFLHAGLEHKQRRLGRDFYLWNIACDFAINSWLVEMNIGNMPTIGEMYDKNLIGMSAEEIYDVILMDIKKYKKLDTYHGYGKGDILGETLKKSGTTSLDDFCRNALLQGLEYQTQNERGFIPAGLIEEIRALSMPPIKWDVELAKWFEIYFPPLEKHRTYSRPSRRQSSTPDIPRPSYQKADIPENSRTFGVIIDTSASVSKKELAMALGSIASFSASKDVPFTRVVFCDAKAYDAGYLATEDIAGRVEMKGGGGTALQPAINLLERVEDFPKGGPILIITDGGIEDKLNISYEHAFLLPRGRRLPFKPKGKVFYFDMDN